MKSYRILALVLCLVGVIFFAVGFVGGMVYDRFLQSAEAVPGEVAAVDWSRSTTTVRFTPAGGESMQATCDVFTGTLHVGDEVTVYYDPLDPSHVKLDVLRVLWLIFQGLGGVFIVASMIVQCCGKAGESRRALLLETGLEVTAHITDVKINRSISVCNYYPYRIHASYTDENGEKHRFHSPDLWRDPSEDIRSDTVTVRVDGDRWNHYAMDLQTCGVDYTQYETLKAAKASRA